MYLSPAAGWLGWGCGPGNSILCAESVLNPLSMRECHLELLDLGFDATRYDLGIVLLGRQQIINSLWQMA